MNQDITLAANTWHDFYAVTGFAPGSDVIGCNRGSSTIVAFEGTQPPSDVFWGWAIPVNGGLRVKAPTAWVKSVSPLVIGGLQVYAP